MTKEKVTWLVVVIFLLIVVIGIVITANNIVGYMESKKDYQKKNDELVNLKKEIKDLNESIALFKAEQEDFEKYLFKEKDIPKFLDGIAKYAESSKVSIGDMKTKRFYAVKVPADVDKTVSKADKKKLLKQRKKEMQRSKRQNLTLAAMPINIKVDGTYDSLAKFMSHLEEFEQLISISKIEIERKSGYPILNCDFTLKIYSFKTLANLEKR